MEKIQFGTDGWRGIISKDFTFKNVERLTEAIANYFLLNSKSNCIKVVVGYDTRFLSSNYAQTVSQILSKKGIDVLISDRFIPTPVLSFTTKRLKADGGIMITASHNPAEYNGIKIKTSKGGAAGKDITDQIEKLLYKKNYSGKHLTGGKIKIVDFTSEYIKFLRNYIDLERLKKKNFKILVDAMYGSGDGFMEKILEPTKIKIDFLRNEINPSFGGYRPEPVLENLSITIEKIKSKNYDLGLVLDGDADRIAGFLPDGRFLHPQKILGLLILHLVRNRKLKGAIVKTIVGTTLIDKIVKSLGLKLYETPVGFKHISQIMLKEDVLIGGEEAGGIGFKNYIPERDGTLAGLLLLEMMAYENKPMQVILKEMEDEFGRYYYLREDIRIDKPASKKLYEKFKMIKSVLGKEVVETKDYDGIKLICSDESWVMIRISGTEPIIRIYAESKSLDKSHNLIKFAKRCFTIS
ncbi:MAG: phosphoglucomutase/phosphomannomutase family protein [Candidatus Omnitrophica bacterium]|nr:phosphoglucomutase/phosphomannomutase family protein [Candidatus Omnitrophota bacterium]MCM8799878.1 phosphoglucomutase/phosphomannomutase family protein [Candidatus Omnitrophota bacterium]